MATLVAPLAFTAWEFMTLAYNPMGSWGSLAYSQYGNLPLMQLVSITGLWGLTFLITWFGATVNWAWEQSFAWPAIRRSVVTYAVPCVKSSRGAQPPSPEDRTAFKSGCSVATSPTTGP